MKIGIIMGHISMLRILEVIDKKDAEKLSEILAVAQKTQEQKIIGELKKENKE
jgi:hypothetical protein